MLVMLFLVLLCFSPFITHAILDIVGKRAAVQRNYSKCLFKIFVGVSFTSPMLPNIVIKILCLS